MPRVHILDPQLVGEGGHYLTHDGQLIRELKRRQVEVSLYARQGCTATCEGIAPTGVFSFEIFREAAIDPQVWAIENFNAVNQAFLVDLCRINTDSFAADDLLYFPNLLQNQLYAVALWLARVPAERRPAVAVMLRYLNHAMDYIQPRANKELIPLYYRYAAQVLATVQPRSFLCADTRELAEAYRKITAKNLLELPNPMDVSEVAGPPSAPNPRPVVLYQGHTSPLRGFHFLPEIVERCATLTPRPKFVLQVQNRESAVAAKLGPMLERLDRMAGADVQIVNGALSPGDYLRLLREADIVLLPYSPTFYGYGSSGVFSESASLGKVIVVSAGTVPARQGHEYRLGVVPALKWTPQSMADAVATAIKRLPILREQSLAAAPRYRQDHCARAFWDKLLAAVGQPSTAMVARA
jgi:glycosyltransferase involved in cell wall biosynthesis